jgi:hypothetical protein
MNVPTGAGLDDILETIRIQWERDVEKNRAEAGTVLQVKVRGRTSIFQSALGRRSQAKMKAVGTQREDNHVVTSSISQT